jgi:hypothetical protein
MILRYLLSAAMLTGNEVPQALKDDVQEIEDKYVDVNFFFFCPSLMMKVYQIPSFHDGGTLRLMRRVDPEGYKKLNGLAGEFNQNAKGWDKHRLAYEQYLILAEQSDVFNDGENFAYMKVPLFGDGTVYLFEKGETVRAPEVDLVQYLANQNACGVDKK